MFNDKRKYLFAAALAILIGFCGWFYYAFKEFDETLIREKAWEKQQDVNLLCYLADKTAGGDKNMLRYAVQYIEENYTSTFAQLYDDQLNPLLEPHEGIGGGKKHDPLDYPEFIGAVTNNESGSLAYWYETEQAGGRDIYMCFKWTAASENGERCLIAVGISKYTIKENIGSGVIYGTVALIITVAVIIIGMVILLCQLGHIYSSRKGDEKWREKTFS